MRACMMGRFGTPGMWPGMRGATRFDTGGRSSSSSSSSSSGDATAASRSSSATAAHPVVDLVLRNQQVRNRIGRGRAILRIDG